MAALFVSGDAFAETVKVSGKVVDRESKPVELATIRVLGTVAGTTTDLDGRYSLSVAAADTIVLRFSCIGFRTVDHKLIRPQGELTLNVKMYPDTRELQEIEVVAYKPNVNGMQSLGNESFDLAPDPRGGSVEGMIMTLPGVSGANELSSRYSVRGGSYDENSVYINGMEIYRPQLAMSGQQEGLSAINPAMTKNVQFSAGGFPARYADKMSSVLDITYRDPEAFEASLNLSLMGGGLSVGQASKRFSQLHGIRYKRNTSLLGSLDTKGEYDPQYFDYQTNLTFKFTQHLSVNFLGNISLNDYKFSPRDRETTFGTAMDNRRFRVYFDGGEHDKFQTWLGALSLIYKRNRSTTLRGGIAAFLSDELVSYDISGEYWLDEASGDTGGGGSASTGVGKYMEHSRYRLRSSVIEGFIKGTLVLGKNNIAYGADYQHISFRDRAKEWEWRDSAGYSLPIVPEGPHLIYNLMSKQDISSNRFAAHAEDAIYLESEKTFVTLNFGARFSYWDFNKEFLASPRANFNITPKGLTALQIRFAAGLYYQSPFYKEYRQTVMDDMGNGVVVLNNDIKSPMSVQFLGGVDYTFRALNRPFKFTGEIYYKHLSRLISYEYDNLKATYSGVNDSKGYAMGLDLRLFGQFVPGSDSWLSFSCMKTSQELNGVKAPLPNDRRYAVTLFFTDYFPKLPRLKFSILATIQDGQTHVAPRSDRSIAWFRAPAYKRLDAGLSYQLVGYHKEGVRAYNFWRHFKSIVVGFDVFNLLDITNVGNYFWITDASGSQYAVPNYLTRRQFNISLTIEI